MSSFDFCTQYNEASEDHKTQCMNHCCHCYSSNFNTSLVWNCADITVSESASLINQEPLGSSGCCTTTNT